MQSEIILLSNVKQDGLAQVVQDQFKLLGISSVKGKRIDADSEAIKSNLSSSLSEYNVIIIIGGVGFDTSLTVKAVSETIGFETCLRDGQTFPKGAEILHNKMGYPSGCAVSQGNQCIIMLPGDRETIEFMLCYRVSEYLTRFTSEHFCIRTLRASGITKANAQKAASDAESFGAQSMVFEDGDEIAVQILSHGQDDEQAKLRNNTSVKNMIAALGNCVYAIDAENIGQALKQELKRKNLTVSAVSDGIRKESFDRYACTYEYPDDILGVTNNIDKYEIPEKYIKKYGKNSDWMAAVLSGEVAKEYGSNIGIGITTDRSRPGEGANIAVSMGDDVWTEKVTAPSWDALEVLAPETAAHLVRKIVSAYPEKLENSSSLSNAVSGSAKLATVSTSTKKKWYEKFIPMAGDSKGEVIRKIIFIVSILVFLGCMAFLSTKAFDAVGHRNLAASLHELFNASNAEDVPDEWEYLPSLYDLYQENNDLIGYIKIENSNVSYPVVQTFRQGNGGETGQYYLRKDYYGNYSMYGTPFLDYRCDVEPSLATNNLIIYGHNIYDDGQMFSDLNKYRQLKFAKEHPVIQFDTLYGEGRYAVIGVVLANAYKKDGPIWDYNNFIDGTEEETKEYINEIAKRTLIVTGVDYNTSDQFLTLSTCCYDFKDARVVVLARKLREGESESDIDLSKAYYSKNPLMPDKWYQALAEKQKKEEDAQFGEAQTPLENGEITDIQADISGMKLDYVIGERFDISGLVLEVTRMDANGKEVKETVTSGFEYSNQVFTEAGKQYVTIMYEGSQIKIEVDVKDPDDETKPVSPTDQTPTISDGKINTKNGTTKYIAGDSLSLAGMTLDLTMSDGSVKTVKLSDIKDKVSGFNTSKEGKQTITVKYDDTHTYTFEVSVLTVKDIKVNLKNTEYKVGDTIANSDVEVKAVLSDGSEVVLQKGYTVTLPDTSNASDSAKITVVYTRNDKTQLSKDTTVVIKKNEQQTQDDPIDTPSEEPHEGSEGGEGGNTDPGNTTPTNPSEETPLLASSAQTSQTLMSTSSSGTSNYQSSLDDTISVNGTTMSMYEAVCRVVRFEAGVGQPDEHVKAQAVATFSYLKNQKNPTGVSMSAMSAVTDQIKTCVQEVIGYALIDNIGGGYVLATYFTESCGYSADAEWVWGYANNNLKSMRISVDNPSGYTYRMTSSQFASKMGSAFNLTGDPSTWIKILNYEDSTPYVKQVSIGGTTIKARALREKYLGLSYLRSTAFTVSYDEDTDYFTFVSYGYGHGVGMSAQASIKYAKNYGYDWKTILSKFYVNYTIKMVY